MKPGRQAVTVFLDRILPVTWARRPHPRLWRLCALLTTSSAAGSSACRHHGAHPHAEPSYLCSYTELGSWSYQCRPRKTASAVPWGPTRR